MLEFIAATRLRTIILSISVEQAANMSLFQFGFTRVNSSQASQSDDSCSVPDYLPLPSECGLGVEEHRTVTSAVSDLADPEPTRKRRKLRETTSIILMKIVLVLESMLPNMVTKERGRSSMGNIPI